MISPDALSIGPAVDRRSQECVIVSFRAENLDRRTGIDQNTLRLHCHVHYAATNYPG
jgi:hypothetical protein